MPARTCPTCNAPLPTATEVVLEHLKDHLDGPDPRQHIIAAATLALFEVNATAAYLAHLEARAEAFYRAHPERRPPVMWQGPAVVIERKR